MRGLAGSAFPTRRDIVPAENSHHLKRCVQGLVVWKVRTARIVPSLLLEIAFPSIRKAEPSRSRRTEPFDVSLLLDRARNQAYTFLQKFRHWVLQDDNAYNTGRTRPSLWAYWRGSLRPLLHGPLQLPNRTHFEDQHHLASEPDSHSASVCSCWSRNQSFGSTDTIPIAREAGSEVHSSLAM